MSGNDSAPAAGRTRKLVQAAVRAPSSHNTQPWLFDVSDNAVALYLDGTRALPVNDPYDRELTISCACALFNLRVAAAKQGSSYTVRLLPDPENEELLAILQLDTPVEPALDEAPLYDAIDRRRTYRKRFAPSPVDGQQIAALVDAAAGEGARLTVVENESTRNALADLVAEGDKIQWEDPSWRRELAAWMHPRRAGDGLSVPWLAQPAARMIVRSFDMGNGVAARDRQRVEDAAVLAVLCTPGDSVADWLSAGQALQHLLLTACRDGLQASYLNQPAQVNALRPRLQELLGVDAVPQIVLRLGYPVDDIEASPRRPLEDVAVACV